jgi:NADP-dependent 3-hydroxy acid dehydrogenase YdfG
MEIRNKVVLITGASSGIGAGVGRRLAKEGAKVALAARRMELLEGLTVEINAQGGQALPLKVDVTNTLAIREMIRETVSKFGRLDVLVNNAGLGFSAEVKDIDPAKLRQQIAVNLVGLIECAQAALHPMLSQGSGHIINVASLAALVGAPGSSVYSATKFGVRGFSDSLRREVHKQGIRVTTFCPGFVATDFSPRLKKILERAPDAAHLPGVMSVEYVADLVAGIIRHPRRMVLAPYGFSTAVQFGRAFPGIVDWASDRFNFR